MEHREPVNTTGNNLWARKWQEAGCPMEPDASWAKAMLANYDRNIEARRLCGRNVAGRLASGRFCPNLRDWATCARNRALVESYVRYNEKLNACIWVDTATIKKALLGEAIPK